MKKLLVGFLALASVSAFSQTHMVQLSGYEGTQQDRSLDLYNSNGGGEHNTTTNLAVNYAYAITSAFQLGGLVKLYSNEGAGKAENENTTYGVFGIWNFSRRLTDTNYLGLKYQMGNNKTKNATGSASTNDDFQTLSAEFGHRFTLGSLWGMTYNWSPSAELGFSRVDPDNGGDRGNTEVRLNVLKVDVLW